MYEELFGELGQKVSMGGKENGDDGDEAGSSGSSKKSGGGGGGSSSSSSGGGGGGGGGSDGGSSSDKVVKILSKKDVKAIFRKPLQVDRKVNLPPDFGSGGGGGGEGSGKGIEAQLTSTIPDGSLVLEYSPAKQSLTLAAETHHVVHLPSGSEATALGGSIRLG